MDYTNGTELPKQCFFLTGDRIWVDGKLAIITEIRADGVMIDFGKYHQFIFCDSLQGKEMRLVVEFKQGKNVGKSYPKDRQSAQKEIDLLKSLKWTCELYREEVIDNAYRE